MLSFSSLATVVKKELRALFDGPAAYVVLVIFLVLWEFLFFRNVFLVGIASVRGLYDNLPWLTLVLIPAVTMGTLAQEKSEGTIELLLTHPLRDLELLIGKFLGSFLFTTFAFAFAFPIAWSLSHFAHFDWGTVTAQFFASLGLAMTLTSLGVCVSSLFKSQVSAMLVSATAGFFLILMGSDFVTQTLPIEITPVLEQLSVLTHFTSMSRGVLDLRDVLYFVSSAAVFLSLAWLALAGRRAGVSRWKQVKGFTGVLVFIALVIVLNLAGRRIPGRLDLTADKRYSITDTTKHVLGGLKQRVTLTLYASDKLPAPLQPVLRDLKDALRDYQTLGNGLIGVETKNPDASDELAKEAVEKGVQQVQFNSIGKGEFQVQHGFLGVNVSTASTSEPLPFVQQTDDLEYRLTSAIEKITVTDKKTIRFLTGHNERTPSQDYSTLRDQLEQQFNIESFAMASGSAAVPDKTDLLVVAGPEQRLEPGTEKAIQDFVENGGSVFLIVAGNTTDPQRMTAVPSDERLTDLLMPYGVKPEDGVVMDIRSNETVNVGGNNTSYLLPYPFWARAQVGDRSAPAVSRLQSATFPWATAFAVDEAKLKEAGFSWQKLFVTSPFGARQTGDANIAPNQPFVPSELGEQLLALSLTKTAPAKNGKTGRLIIVGNAQMFTDSFIGNAPENIAFATEAIGYLTEEETLAGIQSQRIGNRRLLIERASQADIVKYGNLAFALLLPLGIAGWRLGRRKKLGKKTYQTS